MSDEKLPSAPVGRIDDMQIGKELQDSYLTYAMSTIMDRALPDVRDGLKPSQRRILAAMNDLNLRPGRKHIKCAKVVGDTSGNYHPHGDQVIYPTLVRLGQNWNLRYTLVDPQGNFGSTDGDPPAAMRYTECRMTAVAVDMLEDLDLDTVDLQPNYDERLKEPTVLPAKFPNLLVNGSTGIAVGMACNLVQHNLREICDAIVHVIDNPECTLADLIKIVPGPDFPTGGIIWGRDGIVSGYKTGRGRLVLRAKISTEENEKSRRSALIIEEIPYGTIRASIIGSIVDALNRKDVTDISNIADHSGREHNCRIVIDLKQQADPEVVLNQLYKHTQCQTTVSIINIALVNRQPRTMGLKELIEHYIAHRKDVIIRRTKFLLKKAQQRGHILEGLIFAVCDIDEVVRLIRSSKTREEAIAKLRAKAFRISPEHPSAPKIPQSLMDRCAIKPTILTQVQAEAIGRLQLIQLVGLELEKLVSEYRDVCAEIEGYEAILRSDSLVMDIIREDTIEMRDKYGDDRRTQIVGDANDLEMDDLVPREDVVVTATKRGFIKRLKLEEFRAQGRGGRGTRGADAHDDDDLDDMLLASTHDSLLFFTNFGRVLMLRRVYEIRELSKQSAGRAAANLVEFQKDEKIASLLPVSDFFSREDYFLFCTRKGVVKRTPVKAFHNVNRNGIIAITLDEGDTLISVKTTSGADQVLLASREGMAIQFKETEVRSMGRQAGGVKGMELDGEDEVVSVNVVPGETDRKDWTVLTACVHGFGKRTNVDEYRMTHRGGKGVINIRTSDRNGHVVGMTLVRDEDEIMMMSQKGIVIRTTVGSIRQTGRNTQGVTLMDLGDSDALLSITRVPGGLGGGAPTEEAAPATGEPAPDAPEAPDAPAENAGEAPTEE